jgi:hypothetical protein
MDLNPQPPPGDFGVGTERSWAPEEIPRFQSVTGPVLTSPAQTLTHFVSDYFAAFARRTGLSFVSRRAEP